MAWTRPGIRPPHRGHGGSHRQHPDDPLQTLPTSDPYVRRVEFGDAGLITYLINDGTSVVIILDVTWAG
jgi:hypothetical protein